ncbi:MAG: hypothetical protein GTO14_10455 [Anaerolineales bacterium]|nr:hypothetical protein [Anaerolineales bacterium]
MQEENDPFALMHLPLPAKDPALLEALLQPRIALFWGADTPTRALLAMLTTLAVGGRPVRVFDGGNRFDGYFIARLARRMCKHPYAALERIRLSRAFTCFQLAELIENTPSAPEPLFVLDLLTTFYDESVPLRDCERLLATTITHLKRLAAVGPVIVGAREPRALVKERWALLDHLQVAADIAWLLRAPEGALAEQPQLF